MRKCMKNAFFIVVFSVILIFLFSSCYKTCTCKGWVAGEEGKPYKIELEKGEKSCEDKSTLQMVDGIKVGIECE